MDNENVIEIDDSDSDDVIEISENENQDDNDDNTMKWFEDSSESEPELDCDMWDNDCITIAKEIRKNAIYGYHLMPTCPMEHEVPPVKRPKLIGNPSLNLPLKYDDFKLKFKKNWKTENLMNTNLVDLNINPFKHCVIDNFLDDKNILNEIRSEMYEINWNKRNMDLYDFFQSTDLMHTEQKHLKQIYEFLKTDVMFWMQEVTNIELNKISATCSVYTDTDYLLLHDDLQEDRAIAFILYLTDPVPGSDEELWTDTMGGHLELFNRDEIGHPLSCVKQILPKNNRFVFFKVTNTSYHQVSEVLSMDYCRMSINGWFHTPKPEIYVQPPMETPLDGLFSNNRLHPLDANISLENWIVKQYLHSRVKKQIQQHIENESEISLYNYFNNEKFQMLCNMLKNNEIIWERVGPPNRRNYEVMSKKTMPTIIKELLNLFQSKSMFVLLNEYTDLELDSETASIRMELQRWKPKCYSLFSEYDWENENELDVIMYIGNIEDLNIVGGQLMYVSATEKIEDALITLEAKPNCLNIIFRDTARIVKYISKRSVSEYFYMIVCSYKE